MTTDRDDIYERGMMGDIPNTPNTPAPAEDDDEFHERCRTDRESLSPRESADCAGADLAELYENEEDGGS